MTKPKIGIAVIGGGRWGSHHAHVFNTLQDTELLAVCDRDFSVARAFGQEFNVDSVHTDHRKVLKIPGINAVSVATPDFAHAQIILDALAAGKHVLTEKPLATTVSEAETIRDAAAASGRVLMVDFHNRASPAFAAAKQEISNGEIGKPLHVSAKLSNTTFVPLEMLGWASRSSGLWFLGSHLVDILRFLLDDEVVRVFAVKGSGVLKKAGVDTDDFHLSILEFGRGTKATIENSWVLSRDNPMVFDFRVEIVGEAGQIQLNPSHNAAFLKLGGSGMSYLDLFGVTPAGYGRIGGFVHESIARFVDAIRTGTLLASAEDGLAVTRVCAAIEESANRGSPVDLVWN